MIIRQGNGNQENITLAKFKELLASPKWTREMCFDIVDSKVDFIQKGAFNYWLNDFDNLLQVTKKTGWRGINSMLGKCGIFYVESLSFNEYQPESFKISTEKYDKNWCFQGLSVVDENNEPVREDELIACLPELFSKIVVSANEMVDTDADDSLIYKIDDMGENVFQDLLFESTYNRNIYASVHERAVASGSTPKQVEEGRVMEFKLYETQVGSYVCCRNRLVTKEDDIEIREVVVCNNIEEVKSFFGSGSVAINLYKVADISL
ncbi:MAG: hypothetical protein J6N72_07210 [Psychrobacter sp.]|nr:hypothetical protein [Psychrobacter sp.]